MNFKDIFITKQVDFLNKSLLEKLTEFITSLIKHGNLGLARALRFVLSTIENFARGRNSILSGSSSFLSTKSDVCNCQHLFHCPNWFHFHRSGNLSLNPRCHSLLNFKSVEVVSHNPLIKTKSQNVQLVRSWLARWPSRWHCSTRSFSNWSTWQSCSLGFRSRSHSILSPASWSSSSLWRHSNVIPCFVFSGQDNLSLRRRRRVWTWRSSPNTSTTCLTGRAPGETELKKKPHFSKHVKNEFWHCDNISGYETEPSL